MENLTEETGEQQLGKYTVRDLSLAERARRIYGRLFLPEGTQGNLPTVILSHGYGVNHFALVDIAERLAANGIAAYTFDFCGGGIGSKSSGDMMEMTLESELWDLEYVLGRIYDMGVADSGRIYLCGESQGGLISAWCGAKNPNMSAGMILLYPAFMIPDHARERFPTEEDIPEKVQTMGLDISGEYYKNARKLDIYTEIKQFQKPVLIIHGDQDDVVSLSWSRRAVDTFTDARLVVLEGAGHGFYGEAVDVAAEQIVDFICSQPIRT